MKGMIGKAVFFGVVLALLLGMSAYAQDYTKKGTFRWEVRNGLYYAVDAKTGELIRNCKVGKCYVDQNGTRCLNQFVNGIYYNPKGYAQKKFKGGWIKTGDKVYYFYNRKMLTGFQQIGSKYYFFSDSGERLNGLYFAAGSYRYFQEDGAQVVKKGWKTFSQKRYYLSENGIIKEGFFTVKQKQYYQTVVTGIVTGEQVIDGKKYYFQSSGVYDESMTQHMREAGALGNPSDILFFTKFESGNAGYAQTGGDGGKACGKYQFDYRYALIPFLNYCYDADPVFYEGFKDFLKYKKGSSKLIGNHKLYEAWRDIYNADAGKFSSMQDQYALEAYYKPAETMLAQQGIHMDSRPYVIRGAVFSYAIQEGTSVAAQAVVAAGLNDTVPNQEFLEKLYDYRWKDPKGWGKKPAFNYRYTQEKQLALSLLPAAEQAPSTPTSTALTATGMP